ncbi:PPE family protein [Mycobacterium sp. SM1]|uniref:PPE family protein n=1 Tax=Mycobacterium sp. SM1 TaxID=2816243 RepID=UPI001BD1529F|nr:PPE family protein [Mycobacterium sp. SM1]MBS4729922.1 PPE family protein [Mycobacterium sp. SM1]
MDFAVLPPEINSGRMYAGPGPGSMLAAATAWDRLANELYSAAASYGSAVSGLTAGPWLGPSSAAMAAAATPYVAWLYATAAQAEQTAIQARAAAAAFSVAFAMTVHPAVIATNRSLLMTLIATNFFGQNTPAIAATEAHYAEMWAQDAAAMSGYAEASAAASMLTPFTPAPPITNPAGLAGQAAALAQSSAAAATNAQTAHLVTEAVLETAPHVIWASIGPPVGPPNLATRIVQMARSQLIAAGVESVHAAAAAPRPLQPMAAAAETLGGLYGGPDGVSVSLARAGAIGGLSVPQSWIAAAPTTSPAAAASPLTSLAGAPAAAAAETGGPGREMASGLAAHTVSDIAFRAAAP